MDIINYEDMHTEDGTVQEAVSDPNISKAIVKKRAGTLNYTAKVDVESIAGYLPEGFTLSLTDRERQKLDTALKRMSRGLLYTGITACPQIDDAQYGKCAFYADCPFAEDHKPYGSKCPIELAHAEEWLSEYLKELSVDPNNKAEMTMAERLVMIDLEEAKAYSVLAKEGFEEQKITKGEEGVSIEKKLHNAVEYIDRLEKRKMGILKALLATRDSKNSVLGSTANLSASEILSQLREKLSSKGS